MLYGDKIKAVENDHKFLLITTMNDVFFQAGKRIQLFLLLSSLTRRCAEKVYSAKMSFKICRLRKEKQNVNVCLKLCIMRKNVHNVEM